MRLAVGYPVLPDDRFTETVIRYSDQLAEVYFSWKSMPSGRMPMTAEAQMMLEHNLEVFRQNGLALCLLINGNCYGENAISVKFAENIIHVINEINARFGGLESLTTTSPFAAYVVKTNFPDIEVRASVNMRIGTVEGMMYLKNSFDGFYVQREYNRNFKRLRALRQWADDNGKKLYGLLNSGCLNFCSNQSFHDNLVAHEAGLASRDNVKEFQPVICHQFYADPENRKNVRQYSNWIRPEDLGEYDAFFDGGKLATRMHSQASKVIGAYVRGSWPGNLADLLEPGFKELLIDNRAFAEDWLEELQSR